MRALIVEDDKETVDFVSTGLAEKGFICDTAASGEDGLRKMSTHPYDIAIIDITLAGSMSGLDLIKTARKRSIKTPIIVLSALNTAAPIMPTTSILPGLKGRRGVTRRHTVVHTQ